jgi:predicted patatin/cPLA2 family phospholipase
MYGKIFTVSAFAKRHGWNECDGAMVRFVGKRRYCPPLNALQAVNAVNLDDKFENCTAYYFKLIDRDPALFPTLRDFKDVQVRSGLAQGGQTS